MLIISRKQERGLSSNGLGKKAELLNQLRELLLVDPSTGLVKKYNMCGYLASGGLPLIKRKCPSLKQLLHEYFKDMSHICCKTNKDLGLSSTTQPPPSSRCKAQSCRCKRAHSITRKPYINFTHNICLTWN